MTFEDDLLSQHIAIVGKTGSGKTYAAKGLVEALLTEKRRVCILDPTGVWWGLRSSADGQSPGFPIAVFGGSHADVPIAEHTGEALASIVAGRNLPAVIDLSEMLIGQRHRFVTDFAEALYRENRQPLHLVIDEADEFCPQNPMPETKRLLHHIDRIVRRGRVRGFRVTLITQRPAVLHKNVLTQANTLIAMRLTAPQDRNALKAWVEGQADAGQAKEVFDSLARLPRGEGWLWAPELGLLRRQTFRAITTFDSGRTPEEGDTEAQEPAKLADVDLAEIREQFAAVKEEPSTEKQLRAELAKLRKELANSHAAAPAFEGGELARVLQEVVRIASDAIAGIGATAAPAVQQQHAPAPAPRAPAPPAPAPGPVAAGVTAPQQRILDAIASLQAFGLEAPHKTVVAVHAGVSSKSSGYTNNLGALRSGLGLIDYPSAGHVALTAAGRKVANAPDRPATLKGLHQAWLQMVTRPQAAILAPLIECYPAAMAKPALAQRAGVSASSSGYTNNLGALRSLGAIDYPSPGLVQATRLLFPKGKA